MQEQNNFKSDLAKGERSENLIFEQILKGRGWIPSPIQFWFDKYSVTTTSLLPEECDFITDSTDGMIGCEVKSLAGGYDTFCIEKWADDDMSRSPGWIKSTRSGLLRLIIIHNRKNNCAYLYNPKVLLEVVDGISNQHLTRAWNGNDDNSGWITKFLWESKEIGFLAKVELNN